LWTDKEKEEDGIVRMEDKVVAEAAILALVASRVTADTMVQQLSESLITLVETECQNERYLRILLRSPEYAAPLGLVHTILAAFGRGNRDLQESIRDLFAAELVGTVERLPYRAMEALWVQSLFGFDCRHDLVNLLPFNVLTKRIHPISMSRMTAYGATHGIMFATDFGAFAPPAFVDLDGATARVDAALAWAIASEDLDLVLEFLISATLLRKPWSPYAWAAWHFSMGVWDELGFIPSPSFNSSIFASLKGEEAQAYVFRHVYHTVFVAGLLCAILLSVDRSFIDEPWFAPNIPSAKVALACSAAVEKARKFTRSELTSTESEQAPKISSPESPRTLRSLSGLLDTMLPTHLYSRKFLNASPIDPAHLLLVVADAVIIHAARQYDFPKLLIGINAMMARQGPLSLTVVEGVLFLLRQQLSDGCIGVQFVGRAVRESPIARETTSVITECLEAYAIRMGPAQR
jgi:hypothetical protein